MSPNQVCGRNRPAGRTARRLAGRLLAGSWVLIPVAALAVVGGTEDQGPLSRTTVMVLNSGGGVRSAIVVAPDVVLTAAHCATGTA